MTFREYLENCYEDGVYRGEPIEATIWAIVEVWDQGMSFSDVWDRLAMNGRLDQLRELMEGYLLASGGFSL